MYSYAIPDAVGGRDENPSHGHTRRQPEMDYRNRKGPEVKGFVPSDVIATMSPV